MYIVYFLLKSQLISAMLKITNLPISFLIFYVMHGAASQQWVGKGFGGYFHVFSSNWMARRCGWMRRVCGYMELYIQKCQFKSTTPEAISWLKIILAEAVDNVSPVWWAGGLVHCGRLLPWAVRSWTHCGEGLLRGVPRVGKEMAASHKNDPMHLYIR